VRLYISNGRMRSLGPGPANRHDGSLKRPPWVEWPGGGSRRQVGPDWIAIPCSRVSCDKRTTTSVY